MSKRKAGLFEGDNTFMQLKSNPWYLLVLTEDNNASGGARVGGGSRRTSSM